MARSTEFHKRIGNIATSKEVILMDPSEEEWVLGTVVVLKASFTTNRASFIKGDTLLMESGCAQRFIDKNFARPETEEEKAAAIAMGYPRDLYSSAKQAKEAKKARKAAKPAAKESADKEG